MTREPNEDPWRGFGNEQEPPDATEWAIIAVGVAVAFVIIAGFIGWFL